MTADADTAYASPEQWRSQGERFDYRGHDIFFRLDGDGPPLVLLHGFPTSSWDWHRLWPTLTSRFRVLAADFIGFGFSAKPTDHRYSIFDQADLVEQLTAQIGFRRFHLLAHDYGDTVAQELLARDNARASADEAWTLRSVCFLNGGLFPEAHHPRLIQRLTVGPLGPLLVRFYNRKAFGRSFRAIFGARTQPSEPELDAFWSLIRHRNGHLNLHQILRYLHERKRHRERWLGALQNAACPLRMINGGADPVSGAHLAARYRELVADADVVMLDEIGHYPQTEAPAAVLEAFLYFVSRQPT